MSKKKASRATDSRWKTESVLLNCGNKISDYTNSVQADKEYSYAGINQIAKLPIQAWRRQNLRESEIGNGEMESSTGSLTKMDNTLYSQYEVKIRPCIDLIDSLRALGVEKDLDLPAIAVIGDQSSGKSSVLEALSGVPLPRGSGIVTRCPLELKLKKVKRPTRWSGRISYEHITIDLSSPSEVEEEIIAAQNALAGGGVGISDKAIRLEIYSPDVPDLTLIDLPGITRVPVKGQPKNIAHEIKNLISKFIKKQETINLVVVPSNVDIATTEALEMARQVDPSGERTLGILTKPDLVDRGTEEDVVDVVRNKTIPLKKGYMIVKCRGQQDIQRKLSLNEAIKLEKNFFEDNEYYSSLLSDGLATIPVLAERLTKELVEHINKCLPVLEQQIKQKLQEAKEALENCRKGVPESADERLAFLVDIITTFSEDVIKASCGENIVLDKKEEKLFAKVRSQFNNWQNDIDAGISQFNITLKDEVATFERRHRGRELEGFVNYKTFEAIVQVKINELEEPAVANLRHLTNIVQTGFNDIASNHFKYLHNLCNAAKSKIEDMTHKQQEEAENMIRLQFRMEQVVHSQDKLYHADLQSIRKKGTETNASGSWLTFSKPHSTEHVSLQDMSYHLEAYFKGAACRLANQIPIIIRYYLLQEFGKNLQNEMLKLLQDKDNYDRLLQENNDLFSRRTRLRERIKRLNEAYVRLLRFPC